MSAADDRLLPHERDALARRGRSTRSGGRATKAGAAALKISEAAFQDRTVVQARLLGWRVHHGLSVRRAGGGYGTPLQGDAGLPDLILARDGVLLFIELKAEAGSISPAQLAWASAITGLPVEAITYGRAYPLAGGVGAYVLARPRHAELLDGLLSRGAPG